MWSVGWLTDLSDVIICQKACMRAVEWADALSWWSWSASSVIFNAMIIQYNKLSQWRLTADWLAPQESDCLRMKSKVSSDWLPSYIKATWAVLEIFKMSGYFPDSPRVYIYICIHKALRQLFGLCIPNNCLRALFVLRHVLSFFRNQFSTECDLVLPLSISSILSCHYSHCVAVAYFFFFFFSYRLSLRQ